MRTEHLVYKGRFRFKESDRVWCPATAGFRRQSQEVVRVSRLEFQKHTLESTCGWLWEVEPDSQVSVLGACPAAGGSRSSSSRDNSGQWDVAKGNSQDESGRPDRPLLGVVASSVGRQRSTVEEIFKGLTSERFQSQMAEVPPPGVEGIG